MAGEIQWCTDNQGNWGSMLVDLALSMESGFGSTQVDFSYERNMCWFAPSMSDAEQCDEEGGYPTCYHHFWGHEYPMTGCDRLVDCYASDAWAIVDHAREHSDFAGLDVVHVVHWSVMEDDDGEPNVCGGAFGSNTGPDFDGAGVSTDWDHYPYDCPPYVTTHEVGHNFNADHCDSAEVDGTWTVMASEGDPDCAHDTDDLHNFFSDANEQTVNDCATSSDCPRDSRR